MMHVPYDSDVRPAADIFLQPGGWHVGKGNARIRTLLGTCVSIVLWDPVHRVGGMCHYMLPGRSPRSNGLDGRYAEDALQLLEEEVRARGTRLADCRLALTGGGNMFPGTLAGQRNHVGTRNAQAARDFVRRLGLHCDCEHLEGVGHREVLFDLLDGRVQVRQVRPANVQGVTSCAA